MQIRSLHWGKEMQNLMAADLNRIIVAALLSSVFAAPAFADGTGFYGALDVNTWSLSNVNTNENEPSTGFRLAGGYHFTPNWGAEFGYTESGNGVSFGQNYIVESTQFAATGTYPISEQFDVFGKLGYAMNKITGDATSGCSSCSKNDLLYGIGAQYNFNKKIGLRLQYEEIGQLTDTGTSSPEATNYSLGAVYNF
jgi:OOP family OmpA-OmpF porin